MSKNTKVSIPAYEDRLCLFLDILGFKAMIDETVRAPDKSTKTSYRPMTVHRIHSALNAINEAMTFALSGGQCPDHC
jgi:hypothetical protein